MKTLILHLVFYTLNPSGQPNVKNHSERIVQDPIQAGLTMKTIRENKEKNEVWKGKLIELDLETGKTRNIPIPEIE